MSVLGEWARRAWYLLNRGRHEDALEQEMEAHRAMMGAPRRFGNMLRLREDARDVWGWAWLDDLVRDTRFAAKALLRAPGVTLVAIVSLALATGATTAIFSVVDGVLLRPLPFAAPDRLVQLYGRMWGDDRGRTAPDPMNGPVATPELDAFEKQSGAFDGLIGYWTGTKHLGSRDGVQRLMAVNTESGLFSLLGVSAVVGRTFNAADPLDVVVISASLWQRQFGRDPSLPGKTMVLDGRVFTVLGVMPETFQFPYSASVMQGALTESRTDVWMPLEPRRSGADSALRQGRTDVVGRLRPGVTIAGASAQLQVIARRIEAQSTTPDRRVGARLESLVDVVVGPIRQSLWLLFAAVALVLTAACANVANLLLARMTVRTREVVTRAALGASRLRLVRQFLAESLLLSLLGGVLGAFVARWGKNLLVAIGSEKIPRASEIVLDWRTFAFLLAVCLVTAVLFGLAPALTAARVDVQTAMKESGGSVTAGHRYGRIRDGLVVLEVALAFVLALGAAVVVREVSRLQHVSTGMSTDNVVVLHLTPKAPASDYEAIEQRVQEMSGVRDAGFTQLVPLQNWGWEADYSIRGRPVRGGTQRPVAGLRYVTPGYFRTLGIPVVRGRTFTDRDRAEAPHVIVVNQALARRDFPGEDPVGRETNRGTIVGVVGDVRNVRLDLPTDPELYYPVAQNVTMASDIGMSLLVRTDGVTASIVDRLRAAVHEINPNLAIFNVKTLDEIRADSLWNLNLYRWVIGLFSALALTLAAIGLYGAILYNVTSRTREFAVRLALGSDPNRLASLVFARAVRLASAGLVGGCVTVMALVPFVQELPAATTVGPGMYAAIATVLLLIALIACLVPAIRVVRVNPAHALRHE